MIGIFLGISLSLIVFYPEKITLMVKLRTRATKVSFKRASEGNLYNTSLANHLTEIRILCWVLTNPKNHKTKAIHVKNTWGRRCSKLLFMSTERDSEIDEIIALPVLEGRATLWDKTRSALHYIYNHHFHEADYFLKCDDDS